MADIDVVPKHRSSMWVLIVLAIVVIAVLVWAFAGRTHATTRLRHGAPQTLASLFTAPPRFASTV